jgi:predicted transcriptional regulator
MRIAIIAAASALALAGVAAPAVAAPVSVSAIQEISEAELTKYAAAEEGVRAITAQVQGSPTAEQQAAMVSAIEAAGLDLERFNGISTAVTNDALLRARLAVARAPESAPGSVGATATDTELGQFAAAMAAVRPLAEELNGAAPNAEQQAAMAEAIASSGLDIERFNAISAALASDPRLQARVALAEAQRAG